MAKSDDARAEREFVEAARKAGDPRADLYDKTKAAKRKAAPRKAAPRKAAPRKALTPGGVPVDATPRVPRFGGPVKRVAPPSGAPVTPPTPPAPPTPPTPPRRPRGGPWAPAAAIVPPPPPFSPRRGGGGLTPGQSELVSAGHHVAGRQQMSAALGGRPSVSGAAVGGAAGGAATGAALGSIVPGVGTGVGAGVGAGVGGAGGALSGARRKRAYRAAMRPNPGARRALVAEFTLCMVIVALSPLTDKRRNEPGRSWMKRMSALMGVFLLLGLISAMGNGPAKAAASFGGLVAVVLAVSERDLFVTLADMFGGVDPPGERSDHAGEGVTA